MQALLSANVNVLGLLKHRPRHQDVPDSYGEKLAARCSTHANSGKNHLYANTVPFRKHSGLTCALSFCHGARRGAAEGARSQSEVSWRRKDDKVRSLRPSPLRALVSSNYSNKHHIITRHIRESERERAGQ